MGIITITSIGRDVFDCCPDCEVYIDNKVFGKIMSGRTVVYEFKTELSHEIYCSYIYAKNKVEKTNVINIEKGKDYNLILSVMYSDTYFSRVKEKLRSFFVKGYINAPDIELYEN